MARIDRRWTLLCLLGLVLAAPAAAQEQIFIGYLFRLPDGKTYVVEEFLGMAILYRRWEVAGPELEKIAAQAPQLQREPYHRSYGGEPPKELAVLACLKGKPDTSRSPLRFVAAEVVWIRTRAEFAQKLQRDYCLGLAKEAQARELAGKWAEALEFHEQAVRVLERGGLPAESLAAALRDGAWGGSASRGKPVAGVLDEILSRERPLLELVWFRDWLVVVVKGSGAGADRAAREAAAQAAISLANHHARKKGHVWVRSADPEPAHRLVLAYEGLAIFLCRGRSDADLSGPRIDDFLREAQARALMEGHEQARKDKDARALPGAFATLEDEKVAPVARESALKTIVALGGREEALRLAARPGVLGFSDLVPEALKAMGHADAVAPRLKETLARGKEADQHAAIRALERLGSREAAAEVRAFLAHADPRLVRAALLAAAAFEDRAAAARAIEILEQGKDLEARRAAAQAAGRLAGWEALLPLKRHLAGQEPPLRRLALAALAIADEKLFPPRFKKSARETTRHLFPADEELLLCLGSHYLGDASRNKRLIELAEETRPHWRHIAEARAVSAPPSVHLDRNKPYALDLLAELAEKLSGQAILPAGTPELDVFPRWKDFEETKKKVVAILKEKLK